VLKLWRSLRIKSSLVVVMSLVAGGCSGPPRQQEPLSQPAASKQARAATKRRIPPPLFSQAYVEALRNVEALETEDAQELEKRLTENPDDFAARLKLIAYAMRADRAALEESRRSRADLVLWLVENRPDSEILGSPYSIFQPGQLNPDQLARAMRLWDSATKARPSDPRVMWNAANFYRAIEDRLYRASLERAVALAPGTENYARELGELYASAILRNGYSTYGARGTPDPDLVRHAAEVLDTTTNALLLEPAVRLLQSQYNRSLMTGKENAALGELARRYFLKARALDPDIDDVWVFPKLDLKMVGALAPGARSPEDFQARFDAAAKAILSVPPDAFPELPDTIISTLRSLRCTIPQPSAIGPPRNVIRGDFFAQGQAGWAVLCASGGFSSILVFRDNLDVHPEELARGEDKGYLQDGGNDKIAYSREITAVDRKFIMTHYRAYGGPEPPPIDHQGIDDAFLEKASVILYWYEGKWLRLQGAD
jgi:hypothetical protein